MSIHGEDSHHSTIEPTLLWRKRMGIEPTGRPVKDEPTRFEDGGGHQSRARFRRAR